MVKTPETERPLQAQTFPKGTLERLERARFEVATISRNPERIRVLRGHCALLFERHGDGSLTLLQKPGYLVRGEIGRLWDAGYQKFWLLGEGSGNPFEEKRKPALATQLRELKTFEDDLRDLLGLPGFYHESIGSTSNVTAYDRVAGRDSST